MQNQPAVNYSQVLSQTSANRVGPAYGTVNDNGEAISVKGHLHELEVTLTFYYFEIEQAVRYLDGNQVPPAASDNNPWGEGHAGHCVDDEDRGHEEVGAERRGEGEGGYGPGEEDAEDRDAEAARAGEDAQRRDQHHRAEVARPAEKGHRDGE